jgi:DNA topoisomerase-1
MPPKKFYKKKGAGFSKASYSTSIGQTAYLVIVESPSKCGKIEEYLGSQYKCIASKGHFREITGLKQIAIKSNFEPTFTMVKEKSSHVSWMRDIVKQYPKSSIFLATDDDREGEGIAWHLCQVFDLPIGTTKRILFHEITKKAITDAISSPTTLNMDLVKAQHARQVLDIIVGFKISPHLWKHIRGGKDNALSAGRCQTPALRLVYEREKEIRNSILEKKYKIMGSFTPQNIGFVLNREFEKEKQVSDFMKKSQDFQHVLSIKSERKSEKQPPRPFHTSHLLQTANNVLGMSPKITMMTAQKLYQAGLITYMRTENAKYAPPFVETVKQYILGKYGDQCLGNLGKITNFDKKNPHEGIRVTNIQTSSIQIGPRENKLYQLIWRNTLESCMAPALYQVFPLEITAPNIDEHNLIYKKNLELPMFMGWKLVKGEKDSDEEVYLYVKNLCTAGQVSVSYQKISSDLVVHNKISHYNESSLVKKLEDLGIGRPSTYAMLVETIQDRDYVKLGNIEGKEEECTNYILEKGKKLVTKTVKKKIGNENNKSYLEPVGELCIEFLLKYFQQLFEFDYTKNMEDELDKIANGQMEKEWYNLCSNCYKEIGIMSKQLNKVEKEAYRIDELHEISFQQYGPCIKKTVNGEVSYLPIKKSTEINLEKARNGQYKLEELLAIENESLGIYENEPLLLKKGKYGYYLVHNGENISLKEYEGNVENIDLQNAIVYIQKKRASSSTSKHIVLNDHMSIREGKFGPYVFYKTEQMAKPKFLSLKKCNYLELNHDEIIEWIDQKYFKE